MRTNPRARTCEAIVHRRRSAPQEVLRTRMAARPLIAPEMATVSWPVTEPSQTAVVGVIAALEVRRAAIAVAE